jgi:hypothetical protein
MDNKGSIFLIRKTRWGILRSLAVFLDGEKVETVDEDGTVELMLSPGPHEIYVKMDWCRSNKLQFNISAREKVYLACQVPLRVWQHLLIIFYILFLFNKILAVEKVTPQKFDEISKIPGFSGWKKIGLVFLVILLVLSFIYFLIPLRLGF